MKTGPNPGGILGPGRRALQRLRTLAALAAFALPAVPGVAAAFVVSASGSQSPRVVRPGETAVSVFELVLSNSGVLADTLRSLTFTNQTTGAGNPVERDLDLGTLRLRKDDGDGVLEPAQDALVGTATASSGQVRFTNLHASVPALGSARFFLTSDVPLVARDGDALDLSIEASGDVGMAIAVTIGGTFPIRPAGVFTVDGMSAAQLGLHAIPAAALLAGTDENPVLDVTVPANGYQSDVLQRLEIVNLGTAQPEDIRALHLRVDDGDGVFEPDRDAALGVLTPIGGGHWVLSGLALPVPVAGVRLYVSADLDLFATEGRTLRFALPTQPDPGAAMASDNDGPVDQAVAQPFDLSISTANRVTLAASPVASGSRPPGATGVVLAHLTANNRYGATRTLTRLRVTDATQGTGSQADLDQELDRVSLRLDGNDDGVLGTLAEDPEVASAVPTSGRADLTGFTWTLPPGSTRHAFVVADVSMAHAADGDSLATVIGGLLDVAFAESTTIAAHWPLDSGARVGVDGMVAAQLALGAVPSVTLGPGEGPALAMALVVPSNAYRADTLQRLSVVDLGTAAAGDLAAVRAWRDGGDQIFQAGGGDDVDLGPLTWNGATWQTCSLSTPIPLAGVRIWVAITVAAAPPDSVTIRLGVPIAGVRVASGNDGPLDQAVNGSATLLVSNAPLLGSLEATPQECVVGQVVSARLAVRNRSAEAVNGITPSALTPAGAGGLTLVSGPTPATFALSPAASDTFHWTLSANSAGSVQLAGRASGVGATSGSSAGSLQSASNTLAIDAPANALEVRASQSMPSAVARGQAGLAPLTVTFHHPGAAGDAPVLVQRVIVRIEDGNGVGIVPNTLLARVALESGGVTQAARDTLEAAGATIALALPAPLRVDPGASVGLVLRVDVADSTTVPSFRIVLQDSAACAAAELSTGRAIPVRIQDTTYPFRTALAHLVDAATRLDLVASGAGEVRAGRGQSDVPLMALTLTNPGITGLTSDVRLLSVPFRCADTNGVTLPRLADRLTSLRATSGGRLLGARTVYPTDDSTLVLVLSAPLNLPVNTPIDLAIHGDFSPDAPPTRFRAELPDSRSVDARDANSGDAVAAHFGVTPLAGPVIRIEARAESLAVRGSGGFPPRTRIGDHDRLALVGTLRHPGPPVVGRIRVDSLIVLSRDERHLDVAPASVMDRIAVRWSGVEVASATGLPTAGGRTAIALPAALIESGDSARVEILVDVDANAPESFLELSIAATGIAGADANLSTAVAVAADPGFELPWLSGLTHLEPPARELRAALESRMPAALAPDGRDVVAGVLRLRNPAAIGGDTLIADGLVLRAATRGRAALALGSAVTALEAWVKGGPWASSGILTPDSTTAKLTSAAPLAIAAGQVVEIELHFRTVAARPPPDARIGLDSAGVVLRQPASALLHIDVVPEPGLTFPLWTEAGAFGVTSFASSVSNFPNPFAAGRQVTHFAYYLPADARVTLRVATLSGDLVRTAIENAPRGPGMHEGDLWDGVNGVGRVVRNGVYVAELTAEFGDGHRERVLRKVAVVR